MRFTLVGILAVLLLGFSASAWADPADCHLNQISELTFRMVRGQPVTEVRLNGKVVHAVLDTGASRTVLSAQGAARLGLAVTWLPAADPIMGVGGMVMTGMAKVGTLTLGAWQAESVSLMVAGNPNFAPGIEMLIGQDVFSQADVELDFAHNTFRFFQPDGCDGVPLAYWADTYAEAVMKAPRGKRRGSNEVFVRLNGHELPAILDTGAATSIVHDVLAHQVGVHEDDDDVVASGKARGVGAATTQIWRGTFDSFGIGDEEVRHVHLNFGSFAPKEDRDMVRIAIPMLLGMDFIRSHRIYVANSQNKLYFTNVSMPIFDTTKPATPQAAPGP
ncbi:retroviral-like aspartic protease family protein [Nitrospirillum sp. BR 11828]|uniref:retroviral-like aspartic protease family protein n=1 Tax=Nitrospirillum sp. BR 11828 TaxID=3104325 RepID=UPI002ACA0A30|nr:retroviral-like aspartic protease family protein [Nitrospirillum sp. BR 11828]MDZ5648861.1 retroviral-like aspartic protease family protein [Nitrospirillum sp. BR 11828]